MRSFPSWCFARILQICCAKQFIVAWFSIHAIFVLMFLMRLQDAVEYAECEAVVKDFPPFREAMKKRGIEDMDLVMVDAW